MNISIEFKRNQWCVNSYLLKFLLWQKIFITNVAIPLGAEDSLLKADFHWEYFCWRMEKYFAFSSIWIWLVNWFDWLILRWRTQMKVEHCSTFSFCSRGLLFFSSANRKTGIENGLYGVILEVGLISRNTTQWKRLRHLTWLFGG